MKLLLTSAGLNNQHVIDAFISLLPKPPANCSVCMVEYSLNAVEQQYIDESEMELRDLGIKNIHVLHLQQEKIEDDLSVYDCIYVCGGNTYSILDRLRKTTLDQAIKHTINNNRTVYVGVSAGSILAGPDISIAGWGSEGDPNNVGLTDLTGFGFVDFSVFPHFKPKLASEVEAFQTKTNQRVVTLADEQAIVVENLRVTRIS